MNQEIKSVYSMKILVIQKMKINLNLMIKSKINNLFRDNLNKLIEGDLTGICLLMRVNPRTHHMDVIGAKKKRMAGRYEIPFEIDDITSESSFDMMVYEDDDWDTPEW